MGCAGMNPGLQTTSANQVAVGGELQREEEKSYLKIHTQFIDLQLFYQINGAY